MGTIRNILVDIPKLDSTPFCFESAKQLASSEIAKLTFMTVLPSLSDIFSIFETEEETYKKLQKSLEQQGNSTLKKLAYEAEKAGIQCSTTITKGTRARRLISRVIREEHDLLVKDAEIDFGSSHSFFGATDQRLTRHCPCPVLMVQKNENLSEKEQIVIAVDAIMDDPIHRDLNQKLIRYGKALSSAYQKKLHILHVWNFDKAGWLQGSMSRSTYVELYNLAKQTAQKRMDNFLRGVSLSKEEASSQILEGTPSKIIIEYCREHPVHTLVIGSVGRSGLSGYLIGNTAERVMSGIQCSVLVASPKQVQSPLEIKLREEIESQYTELART